MDAAKRGEGAGNFAFAGLGGERDGPGGVGMRWEKRQGDWGGSRSEGKCGQNAAPGLGNESKLSERRGAGRKWDLGGLIS